MGQLENLYPRQIDYTRDYTGFLVVLSLLNNFDMLREIGQKIGMQFSERHSQLLTSIQFESFEYGVNGKPLLVQRLKVYTKQVHLLTTTSFKSKLSMGTSKLFKAPLAFHQKKIQPSFNDGLTRIELSSYFHSLQEWKEKATNVDCWEQKIASIYDALHNASEQLVKKVTFKVFWDSFWLTVDSAISIVVLEPDLWTIVYAYSRRSYLFTGHHTDKHNKSGSWLTFLQRFTGAKTLVRVNNGNQIKEFLIHRNGTSRQIPIESLNVIQHEQYRFPIEMNKWFYHLSKEQLEQIYFICDNQEEFDEWFGQDSALTRPNMSEFQNQIDPHTVIGCQLLERGAFQEEYRKEETHTIVDFQKKRQVKFTNKEEIKEMKRWQVSSTTREDPDGIDVTRLIVSDRDSKTGKRFKVFSTLQSHQYGNSCQFSSSDKGATYSCSHCNMKLIARGRSKDNYYLIL